MNKGILRRIETAENNASNCENWYYNELLQRMTTDELEELIDDATTEERFIEILEEAKQR